MELVNHTAVPASLQVGEMSGGTHRGGLLVAKATFSFDNGSSPRLVTDNPAPILDGETELGDVGHLPADTLPRDDDLFEVLLLGACHAPRGRPASAVRVSMSVGDRSQQLLVTGDRSWIGEGRRARISDPRPFTRMPMTYARAFGGTHEIMLDPRSKYPVLEPLNATGRGFDPHPYLESCVAMFECAPGYPKLAPQPRLLPNLEDPRALIRTWDDHPEPACWATIPANVGFRATAMQARLSPHGSTPPPHETVNAAYLHAHPDWTLPQPPPRAALVRLEGVAADGDLAFRLPSLRVVADYELGQRHGTLALKPHVLVLLTEQRRFHIVYRAVFAFETAPKAGRSFRLRLVEGWYPT